MIYTLVFIVQDILNILFSSLFSEGQGVINNTFIDRLSVWDMVY